MLGAASAARARDMKPRRCTGGPLAPNRAQEDPCNSLAGGPLRGCRRTLAVVQEDPCTRPRVGNNTLVVVRKPGVWQAAV